MEESNSVSTLAVQSAAASIVVGAINALIVEPELYEALVSSSFWDTRLHVIRLTLFALSILLALASLVGQIRNDYTAATVCAFCQLVGLFFVVAGAYTADFAFDSIILAGIPSGVASYFSLGFLSARRIPPRTSSLHDRHIVAILAGIIFSIACWPVGAVLLVAAGVGGIVRRGEGWWSEALRKASIPTALGAFVLGMFSLLINTWPDYVSIDQLRVLEVRLLGFRNLLDRIATPSWILILALLIILIAISSLRPNLRIVHRFGALREILSFCAIALTACTTFTFFSQVPLDRMARSVNDRQSRESRANIDEFVMLLRFDWENVGTELAAEALRRSIVHTEPAIVRKLADQLSEFQVEVLKYERDLCGSQRSDVNWLDEIGVPYEQRCSTVRSRFRENAVREFARTQTRSITLGDLAGANPSMESATENIRQRLLRDYERFRAVPRSVEEWRSRERVLAEQRISVDRIRVQSDISAVRAREAVTGVRQLFVEAVGAAAPQMKGLADHYAGNFISSSADRFFKRAVARWYTTQPGAKLLERLPMEAREAILQEVTPGSPVSAVRGTGAFSTLLTRMLAVPRVSLLQVRRMLSSLSALSRKYRDMFLLTLFTSPLNSPQPLGGGEHAPGESERRCPL